MYTIVVVVVYMVSVLIDVSYPTEDSSDFSILGLSNFIDSSTPPSASTSVHTVLHICADSLDLLNEFTIIV